VISSPSLAITLSGIIAYFLGGVPFGYLFVRFTLGKDVRTMGSGNIGATNVHRTAGGKAGVIVLLLDILKGVLAVWLASVLSQANPGAIAAAMVGVVLGHCYPVLLGFKGGKAVACFIGATLYVAPLALLVTSLIFLVLVAWSRYISLGSIVGAAVFPLVLWLTSHPPSPILLASVICAALIVLRHRGNIQRLRTGTESVFSLKGGSAR
jgi:glycerol-3-phosphate acyltransferase PlsY